MNRLSALIISILCFVSSWAYDVQVDGIYYNLDRESHTAAVTHGTISVFYYIGNITIPQTFTSDGDTYTVTAVGDSAFWYCRGLLSVNMPNTVNRIGDYAMQGCSLLKTVGMSNAVEYIGDYAFAGDEKITSLVLPPALQKIKEMAFFRCSGIERFDIPDATTEIEKYAFSECRAKTITIGSGLTTLGSSAFADNTSLTSINIPGSLKRIEYYTFEGCTSLKDITLNEGLEYLSERTFSNTAIENITLPATLDTLAFGVFRFAETLKNITCLPVTPPAADDIFYGIKDLSKITLSVPAESVNAYKEASSWGEIINVVKPITTAINTPNTDINNDADNGKFIKDGRLMIISNGRKYNVAGQILNK